MVKSTAFSRKQQTYQRRINLKGQFVVEEQREEHFQFCDICWFLLIVFYRSFPFLLYYIIFLCRLQTQDHKDQITLSGNNVDNTCPKNNIIHICYSTCHTAQTCWLWTSNATALNIRVHTSFHQDKDFHSSVTTQKIDTIQLLSHSWEVKKLQYLLSYQT